MKDKEFKERKKEVNIFFKSSQNDDGFHAARKLIRDLFQDKEYGKIIEVFDASFIPSNKLPLFIFEVAYSLGDLGYSDRAKEVYEFIIGQDPDNSSVLNNLYVIVTLSPKTRPVALRVFLW